VLARRMPGEVTSDGSFAELIEDHDRHRCGEAPHQH
jgi:hypothetical protein